MTFRVAVRPDCDETSHSVTTTVFDSIRKIDRRRSKDRKRSCFLSGIPEQFVPVKPRPFFLFVFELRELELGTLDELGEFTLHTPRLIKSVVLSKNCKSVEGNVFDSTITLFQYN